MESEPPFRYRTELLPQTRQKHYRESSRQHRPISKSHKKPTGTDTSFDLASYNKGQQILLPKAIPSHKCSPALLPLHTSQRNDMKRSKNTRNRNSALPCNRNLYRKKPTQKHFRFAFPSSRPETKGLPLRNDTNKFHRSTMRYNAWLPYFHFRLHILPINPLTSRHDENSPHRHLPLQIQIQEI